MAGPFVFSARHLAKYNGTNPFFTRAHAGSFLGAQSRAGGVRGALRVLVILRAPQGQPDGQWGAPRPMAH